MKSTESSPRVYRRLLLVVMCSFSFCFCFGISPVHLHRLLRRPAFPQFPCPFLFARDCLCLLLPLPCYSDSVPCSASCCSCAGSASPFGIFFERVAVKFLFWLGFISFGFVTTVLFFFVVGVVFFIVSSAPSLLIVSLPLHYGACHRRCVSSSLFSWCGSSSSTVEFVCTGQI